VERMLGYTAAEVAVGGFAVAGGLTLNAISATLQGTIARATQEDFPLTVPFEAVCVTADGQNLDVLIGIALLNPDEAHDGWQVAAFIADLTMQKKSEEVLRQTEKLAVAGRLAASIAHEINNPLEAITNCLYLMERAELTAEARSYLTMAQKELDRVSKITMQTLRFYRRSTRPQLTDVTELVESVLGLMEPRLGQQEIEVKRDFRPIPQVIAHDGEVRQVLANLVGNAIDALPTAGRLVLRVAPARDWKNGRVGVKVTVADNGTGMDDAVRNRIFEPFFSTKGITGTGLGLWISREIVEKHAGHLRVWSSRARAGFAGGTVFALFLPLNEVETVREVNSDASSDL
jgi:signal transduction histidine kinase